ncbi:hypothetical protein NVP1172O_41 [Vibrio phage 1.172.O._10N.261.52.F5]|nr:hypothetical protein NVP1116O_41 [Vibrio phage 1.116.O._10N.222.52.C10]AUR92456.1 hypothetical protein NVP1172O_41 [Vibrio phage 1.172.O._10N.261.52.F5]
MKASEQAKELGAKSLQQVADFHGCTTAHLRNVHKRNPPSFRAMVIGYLIELERE